MDTVLNELSLEDMANTIEEARQKMTELLMLLRPLNELEFNRLRLPNSDFFGTELTRGYTVNDWLVDTEVRREYKTLFLGLKSYPYFDDLKDDSEEQYVSSRFTLGEAGHPLNNIEVLGLADAYLRNTLSVSFCSHQVWQKCKISINIYEEDIEERKDVFHACSTNCINGDFLTWYKRRIRPARPPLNSHADVDFWFPLQNNYRLTEKAKDDLIYFYQENQMAIIAKVESFFAEIWETPFKGTGQVELLKHNLAGWWSRRINHEHRLVYRYENDILIVRSCQGHYTNL